MIRSLSGAETSAMSLQADVLIVGAGIAGLLIGTKLSRAGKRVIVVESGGERQEGDTHPLNEVEYRRAVYAGALEGRARCLGGTSTLWGGAMIPYQAADLSNAAWPLSSEDLAPYQVETEQLFGLPDGPYDLPGLTDRVDGDTPSHIARLAKWPAFRQRNVARLFDHELRSERGPDVWLNATASYFTFRPDGGLESLTAISPNGRQLKVRARNIVLAAGAIESTRLLLIADRQANQQIFAPDEALGRYFSDHLSVRVGRIFPTSSKALNRVIGFRFEGRAMRNLRFEIGPDPAFRALIPPGFAHIAVYGDEGGGFDALRDMFRKLQRRQLPNTATLINLARAAPWLLHAFWWRSVEKRLLFPAGAVPEVHVVIEQESSPRNRITLSDARCDPFGQPLAVIDWGVSERDRTMMGSSADLFFDQWTAASHLSKLGRIDRRPFEDVAADLTLGGGIYHPSGSTRMGSGPRNGVVDANLRCFRIPNLSVAATSVFPTGGGANPTMTLMQASLRLADSLKSV